MSRLYSVVDYNSSCPDSAVQVAGRRPSRMRQQRAEAEMLDALASYLDLAMVLEGVLACPNDHGPSRIASGRYAGA